MGRDHLADAVIIVHSEFEADPKAKAENADMLAGFDPDAVTVEEIGEMYKILKGFKVLRDRFGVK